MADLNEDYHIRFGKIVPALVASVDPGYGSKKSKDREIAVTQFMWDVLKLVEDDVPQLKVSELLRVGSYNEGTKIMATNEFDFLAVVDELSQPGVIKVVTDDDTKSRPGTVKLKLANEAAMGERWRMFCKNGYLRCFEEVRRVLDEDSFGRRVMLAIPKLEQNKNRQRFGQNNDLTYAAWHKPPKILYSRSKPPEHVAMVFDAEAKFPNILLKFVFDGEEVTADLCPAIRYNNVKDCFNPENCIYEKLSTEVINRGSILLVGQENFLFRVTYTETEVDYMKNKISTCHKYLYILLKTIAHGFTKWDPLPSYALKTICIKHDLLCQRTEKANSLLKCFDEVLEELNRALHDGKLLSVFDKRLNIFYNNPDHRKFFRKVHVTSALNRIREYCHNTVIQSPEQLLQEIKSITKSTEKSFVPMDERGFTF